MKCGLRGSSGPEHISVSHGKELGFYVCWKVSEFPGHFYNLLILLGFCVVNDSEESKSRRRGALICKLL